LNSRQAFRPKAWSRIHRFGFRLRVEGAFSVIKRVFGECVCHCEEVSQHGKRDAHEGIHLQRIHKGDGVVPRGVQPRPRWSWIHATEHKVDITNNSLSET
jgi:hypothetical protein